MHFPRGLRNLKRLFETDSSKLLDILVVSAVALLLRLINLDNYPRWFFDEGSYAQLGLNVLASHFGYYTRTNFFPPLFVAIESVSLGLLPQQYFAARLPGAVMGTLSCIMLYAIARRIVGRPPALSAALILAFSSAYINRVALQDNALQLFFLLTIFCYVNWNRSDSKHWLVLSGIMAGLAFLSKLTGVCAALFLALQGLLERSTRKIGPALLSFAVVASFYPIIGALIDWQTFLLETFGLQATREALNPYDLLFTLSLGAPASQLETYGQIVRTPLQIFTVLGFASTIIVMITGRGLVDRLISVSVSSIIITFAASEYVWWGFLAVLYPFYALSTSLVIIRLFTSRRLTFPSRNVMLGLVALLSTVLTTMVLMAGGIQSASFRTIFFTLFAVLGVALVVLRTRLLPLLRRTLIILLIIALVFPSISQLQQVQTTQTTDQMQVVDFVNSHAAKNQLVAANPAVAWLFEPTGLNYAEVAFYTTREETLGYVADQAEHFVMNVSLWNCKYIVLDTPWLRDELGHSKSVQMLTPIILAEWTEVYSVGDYRVYENPGRIAYRVEGTVLYVNGTQVEDVLVSCFNAASQMEFSSRTDSKGQYVFLVPPGSYAFDVWPPAAARFVHYRDPSFKVSSNVLKDVVLEPGLILMGSVKTEGNTPEVNVRVSLYDVLNGKDYETYTVNYGAFGLIAPAGTYVLDAWPPNGTRLLHYQDRNFTLSTDTTRTIILRSGFMITGYVFSPNNSTTIPGCWVSLFDLSTREVFGSWTDPGGYYAFLAPPGKYILDIWPPKGAPYKHTEIQEITIQSDTSLNLNLIAS